MVDLSAKSPYRIIDGADGVRIVFGESDAAMPAHAPLAALRTPEPEPARMAAAVPVDSAPARPLAVEPLVMPALPEPQAPAPAADAGVAPEQGNIGQACGQTGDLGTPISLDFKDGDLQDIFRLFSDISGLNVVVNPGVTGKVTLKLNEVPWGRALELILKTNGLGCVLEDNVIRIARLTDLQKEEGDRRKLDEEKALAGDPDRLHASHLLREGERPVDRAQERRRALRARPDQRRPAHQHDHHPRPADATWTRRRA